MVSEPILTSLLGQSGHPLSGHPLSDHPYI